MFSRFFVTALVALPMVALAAPQHHHGHEHEHDDDDSEDHHQATYSCNVGTLTCCKQVQSIPGNTVANALGIVGIPVNILPLIGLDCDPIPPLIGIGGNNCAAQPVCCTGNNFPGLVNALNCSPANVDL